MNKQYEALKMDTQQAIDFLYAVPIGYKLNPIDHDRFEKAIDVLAKALAEAEKQHPVAWMYEDELPDNYPYEAMFQYSAIRDGVRMFPVFHPATWQSLSDDEIEYLECLKAPPVHPDFINDDSWYEFARAIEQALKEKND